MSTESLRSFEEWINEHESADKLVDVLIGDIANFKRMSHDYARKHHGPNIIQKAAMKGVHLTNADLEHILALSLGVEVHVGKFDKKVYDHHM